MYQNYLESWEKDLIDEFLTKVIEHGRLNFESTLEIFYEDFGILIAELKKNKVCECCQQRYESKHIDSCRCIGCCWSCYYDRDLRKWIQGNNCPSKRK